MQHMTILYKTFFFLNCVRVSTDLMLYHLECFIVYFLQILQHNHITTIKVKILPSNPQMVFMVCQLSYHSLFTMKRSSSETHRVLYYHVSLVFSLEYLFRFSLIFMTLTLNFIECPIWFCLTFPHG